jgi:hypothetical protein
MRLVVFVFEVKLHAITRWVTEKQLNQLGFRDKRCPVWDAAPGELLLIAFPAAAPESSMVEGADRLGRPIFGRPGFGQVQDGLPSGVKPVAEAAEWRAVAHFEADDLTVEITQLIEQRSIRAQIVVTKTDGWHLVS